MLLEVISLIIAAFLALQCVVGAVYILRKGKYFTLVKTDTRRYSHPANFRVSTVEGKGARWQALYYLIVAITAFAFILLRLPNFFSLAPISMKLFLISSLIAVVFLVRRLSKTV